MSRLFNKIFRPIGPTWN